MTLHSKAAFARMAGVTRPAIAHVLESGLLVATTDGKIDDAHPLVLAYLERRRNSSPSTGKGGTGRPVEGGAGAPIVDTDTGDEHDDEHGADRARSAPAPRSLAEQKLALDIKLRRERLRRDHLLNLKEVGALVESEYLARMGGCLAAALEADFRSFADRHADQLVAMCAAGAGRIQIADLLDTEIDKSMQRVVGTVHRELDKLRPLTEHIADTPELRWLARLLCPTCGGRISKAERATLNDGRRDRSAPDRSAWDRSGRAATVSTDEADVIT